ncbi:hypothetical protein RHABOEDO_000208 [Candidatus Rhabdochlamydia oedothoracis]|uniref:Uncharacterized protein n=1 Tax=Candidatus Rhabdochlamydia oedothoracis TaxID=2720720 RepID=A0ABX8UYR8_9BACT|nr:hypothetical protein RHABOEDO_000208 [Candidatus Rhabdochlamydia oedothoracis]
MIHVGYNHVILHFIAQKNSKKERLIASSKIKQNFKFSLTILLKLAKKL